MSKATTALQPSLGFKCTCLVTGFSGIATSLHEFTSGMVQLGIQPPIADGKMVDAIQIDVQQLSVGVEVMPATPPTKDAIRLGDRVVDSASQASGVVTSRVTFLNGCVYYNVVLPVNKDGEVRDLFVPAYRLNARPAPRVETPLTGKGGPMSVARRA